LLQWRITLVNTLLDIVTHPTDFEERLVPLEPLEFPDHLELKEIRELVALSRDPRVRWDPPDQLDPPV
jgi:hypothetical protein